MKLAPEDPPEGGVRLVPRHVVGRWSHEVPAMETGRVEKFSHQTSTFLRWEVPFRIPSKGQTDFLEYVMIFLR